MPDCGVCNLLHAFWLYGALSGSETDAYVFNQLKVKLTWLPKITRAITFATIDLGAGLQ